jgi:hypothetical protein
LGELFCQDYKVGDGTKALVKSTKKGFQELAKAIGFSADFENHLFDVPSGCRRFILKPDTGKCFSFHTHNLVVCFSF